MKGVLDFDLGPVSVVVDKLGGVLGPPPSPNPVMKNHARIGVNGLDMEIVQHHVILAIR